MSQVQENRRRAESWADLRGTCHANWCEELAEYRGYCSAHYRGPFRRGLGKTVKVSATILLALSALAYIGWLGHVHHECEQDPSQHGECAVDAFGGTHPYE